MTHVRPIDAACPLNLPEKDQGSMTYDDSPEGIAHDNYRRATFAAQAVKAYADATGLDGEGFDTVIGDMLGDLLHLLDCLNAARRPRTRSPLDVDVLLDRGRFNYEQETEGAL